MIQPIEILPLTSFTQDEIWPIVTGYESDEKYAVEKAESDERTVFSVQLVGLDQPYRSSFVDDFIEEEFQRFLSYLPQGYSFGAYHGGRLVGFAIGEVEVWNRSLRIWEFQVMEGYRRQGIGRALMSRVVERALESMLRIVVLETQNTNVKAIRFYRSMGFSLEAIDLSLYSNHDMDGGEVAFFMKRRLE